MFSREVVPNHVSYLFFDIFFLDWALGVLSKSFHVMGLFKKDHACLSHLTLWAFNMS